MANARALTACLARLGLDIPTRKLIDRQRIRALADLTALPFPEIEKMIQRLSRWKSCMGDELKLTNFEDCQQCFFKTIVENTKMRTK
jgi:hypothetical protein